MNQVWDPEAYSLQFNFVSQYGQGVLDLIEKDGVKTILDLGCGTGVLTKSLSDEGYQVTGIDSSSEMLEMARRNYPNVNFIESDATNFELITPVDVVFSNAVLHWIDKDKQLQMMKCVYRALTPGGQFVFEMGGKGNNKMIHSLLSELFHKRGYEYKLPFYFPSIGEYASLLESAGFTVRNAILFDRPTPLKGENGLADWLRMFQNTQLSQLSVRDKEEIIFEAVNTLKPELYSHGIWYSDYVRLRVRAVKES